jgi:2-oxoglutarate ferredoxin oxidoreductase subunit delta
MKDMATPVERTPVNLHQARRPRGRVFVIPDRCKGCNYCIEFCPHNVLVASAQMNAKGYHYPVVAPGKESECIHCRFCDLICPELAIFTEELSDTP